MRKLLVLVILAVPLLLVVTVPARVAIRVLDLELPLEQVSGTIWRGRAIWPSAGQAPLDLDWRWRAPLRWQWRLSGPETELGGGLEPSAQLRLTDVAGFVPVDRLDVADWLPFTRPEGRLSVALPSLILSGREVVEADGRLVWEEARLSGAVDENLGRIELDFSGSDGVAARVRSLDPVDVQVRGTLEIKGTAYDLDVWLHARNPEVQRSLARMGEVRPDGQVRLRQEGDLF